MRVSLRFSILLFERPDDKILPMNSIVDPAKFKIEDILKGQGEEVRGERLCQDPLHGAQGMLLDGTEFDSSYKRGAPFKARIGVGQVIDGWNMGVVGMEVGEKRRPVIPPV